jgi:hypothetical protein
VRWLPLTRDSRDSLEYFRDICLLVILRFVLAVAPMSPDFLKAPNCLPLVPRQKASPLPRLAGCLCGHSSCHHCSSPSSAPCEKSQCQDCLLLCLDLSMMYYGKSRTQVSNRPSGLACDWEAALSMVSFPELSLRQECQEPAQREGGPRILFCSVHTQAERCHSTPTPDSCRTDNYLEAPDQTVWCLE